MTLVCKECGGAVVMRGSVLSPGGFDCHQCGATDSQVHEHEYRRQQQDEDTMTLYNEEGKEYTIVLLPEGVWDQEGRYYADCTSCGEPTEIECDLDDFELENHYCGGSPRCCP